jgi:hypothetical protein
MKIVQLIFLTLSSLSVMAQGSFSPSAGVVGTTAIHKDSSVIIAWANGCITQRGPQDISQVGSPLATTGDDSFATGMSGVNGVVSLGDGGSAILTFSQPIIDGIGPDFAIFENGFSNDFLELALVEVSSDGINFFRFDAVSETQDTTQTGSFGSTDATMLNNLAGKYRAQFGTPFDLNELSGQSGLDVNQITHVKIIDVVGSIDENYASYDSFGNKINDPYPTGFASGGFDLDAVGVIHQEPVSVTESDIEFTIYPNPSNGIINIIQSGNNTFQLFNIAGELVHTSELVGDTQIDISMYSNGVYFARIGSSTQRIVLL